MGRVRNAGKFAMGCPGKIKVWRKISLSSLPQGLKGVQLERVYGVRYFGDHGHVSQRSIRFKVLNCTHATKRSKAMNRHKFT